MDELIAIYSASADDNDTVACFLLVQLTAHCPILMIYPVVDFLSSASPAQAASAYPTIDRWPSLQCTADQLTQHVVEGGTP